MAPNSLSAMAQGDIGFGEFPHLSPELAIIWYDVAEFLDDPKKGLHKIHATHPWKSAFLPPKKTAAQFQVARREFDINPSLMIDVLWRFAVNLKIQEIGMYMCKSCEYPATFLQICKEIRQRFAKSRASTATGMERTPGPATTKSISPMLVTNHQSSAAGVSQVPDEIAVLLVEYNQTYQPFDMWDGKEMTNPQQTKSNAD